MKKASGKQTRYRLLVGMLIGIQAMGLAKQGYAEKNMQNEEARRLESSHSALAALSQPGPIVGSTPDSPVSIRLRVYNYAHLNAPLLNRAREVTTAILRESEVETTWVDCPLTRGEFESYPACQTLPGTTDFIIKILTAEAANRFCTHREALGQALECARGQAGCSAYVFYRDVVKLAREGDAAEDQLLGHVLAHEIGHLLLGPNSHTPDGIMRAHWTERDLQTIARTYLVFSEQQSRRIREEVLERNSVHQEQWAKAKVP